MLEKRRLELGKGNMVTSDVFSTPVYECSSHEYKIGLHEIFLESIINSCTCLNIFSLILSGKDGSPCYRT